MFRSRFPRALLLLAGLTGVMYVLVSLYLPSSRRLIFGVDKANGYVRLVQQRVTFLPPHRFYRLNFEKREGAAQRDGLVQITSKEGVPVTISYRLRFNVAPGRRLPDAQRLVRDGWSAWIRARVSEATSAVAAKIAIEELLSPGSRFYAQRETLRNTVARHLARNGLNVTAFAIARAEPDAAALLRYKRAELRRSARGVAGRVAIFAIDGADWELLNELSNDGRIPNIRALVLGGTTASMQSIQPTASPLVWTTMATGVTPDRHGVIDFIDRTSGMPVDSMSRRAPAIWDIAEAFGREAGAVNWWTAWPPTSETATFDTPVQQLVDAAFPARTATRARSGVVPLETVGSAQVRRFLNITDSEYERAVGGGDPADPVNVFRSTLAKTWSDHRGALQIYSDQRPLLMMVHYEGTDVVNHLFGPYHPPYREGMSQEGYRKYWPTVANYYSEVDRLIGEWMNVLSEDTTVMIVSAHGFRWGKTRPRVAPAGRSAISDHRSQGIFIAYGNHVVPSRAPHAMSIYDVVPTILAILGLPKSSEMPGNLTGWALRDITAVESVRVVSYREFTSERPLMAAPRLDRTRYESVLQSIGHRSDPSRQSIPILDDDDPGPARTRPITAEREGAYAYYNNLGIELRSKGKFREAIEAFETAISMNPSKPVPFLNLAMTLIERQQYTAAEELLTKAVERGLPNADQWFVDMAAYYRKNNMTSRAITVLYKGRQIFPQSYAIAANLGSALAQANRYTEGLPELERALAMQPSSTLVLNNIGTYYARQKDFSRALDFWYRSLTIDPRQPSIRAMAEAAKTQL